MLKKKLLYYAKELLFIIIFMSVIANLISLYKSQELNQAPLVIKSFHLIDNSNYNIDSTKPLLVHFWATWCPTCKLEAGNIKQLSKYYNVITIAVKSGSSYDIHNYLKQRDLKFNVVNDKDSQLAQMFKIQAYPTTFIYDQNQNLVFSEVGYTSTFGLFLRMWWVNFFK